MARSIAVGSTGAGRSRGLLIIAIAFGVLSFILAFVFLQSQDGKSSDSVLDGGIAPEQVVVAIQDISPGQRITADMVELQTVPGAALQNARFNDLGLVVDKTSTTLILAGEQVVAPKITAFEGLDILSARIPESTGANGYRGLALTVAEESWIVGGLVQPGDRVDIIGITTLVEIDELTGTEKLSLKTGIIAENVEVLAVAQTITGQIPNLGSATTEPAATGPETGTEGTDGTTTTGGTEATGDTTVTGGVIENNGTFAEALSVTLALTPEQSSLVALIDAMKDDVAQWRLIVRQQGDETPIQGDLTWDLDDVFAD